MFARTYVLMDKIRKKKIPYRQSELSVQTKASCQALKGHANSLSELKKKKGIPQSLEAKKKKESEMYHRIPFFSIFCQCREVTYSRWHPHNLVFSFGPKFPAQKFLMINCLWEQERFKTRPF